jgi:hypothetical protein
MGLVNKGGQGGGGGGGGGMVDVPEMGRGEGGIRGYKNSFCSLNLRHFDGH